MSCRKYPIVPIVPPPPPEPPPPGPDPGPDPGPTPGPTGFFYSASYYGAIGCTSDDRWRGDLDRLKQYRISNVRVWYDWPEHYSPGSRIIKKDGTISTDALNRFLRFYADATARGFKIDLSSTGPGSGTDEGTSYPHYNDFGAYFRGLENMATALKSLTALYPVDVCNEFTAAKSKFGFSVADVVRATQIVKTICPKWNVTTSMDGDVGTIGNNYKQILAGGGKVDVLAPHFRRDDGWGAKAYQRVGQLKADLATVGVVRPIYLQEESWAGEAVWSVEQSTAAAGGSKSAGAIGYCFHTDAGFNLTSRSFFEQLRSVEITALQQLP